MWSLPVHLTNLQIAAIGNALRTLEQKPHHSHAMSLIRRVAGSEAVSAIRPNVIERVHYAARRRPMRAAVVSSLLVGLTLLGAFIASQRWIDHRLSDKAMERLVSLDGAEGWFTWPVIDGQKICPSPEMVYCWQVSAVETGYALSFYTGPDEQTYELEPGTGISRFHYAHHGTTNEVEAKLTKFTAGKR